MKRKTRALIALRAVLSENMMFKDKMFYVEEPRLCSHKRILEPKAKRCSTSRKGR